MQGLTTRVLDPANFISSSYPVPLFHICFGPCKSCDTQHWLVGGPRGPNPLLPFSPVGKLVGSNLAGLLKETEHTVKSMKLRAARSGRWTCMCGGYATPPHIHTHTSIHLYKPILYWVRPLIPIMQYCLLWLACHSRVLGRGDWH